MSSTAGPTPAKIVVGVDGSEGSKEALTWALRQAQLTGASIEVVIAWTAPIASYGAPFPLPDGLDLAADATDVAQNAVAEALAGIAGTSSAIGPARPQVTVTAVEGHPVAALLRAAKSADLLVVGSHGHGLLAGTLLGSVSERCVLHAPCPTVVVRSHPHQPASVARAHESRS